MTDQVSYSMSLGVYGGPSVPGSGVFEAEAYEKVEATIPHGSTPTTVNLQPSDLADLQALIITAESYEDLTFTVDEGETTFTLSGPLMLIGAGLIGMLGATLNALVFTNADEADDNDVTILIARTAVEAGS